MTEICARCRRSRPDYIADPSCREGGYCLWVDERALHATLEGNAFGALQVTWQKFVTWKNPDRNSLPDDDEFIAWIRTEMADVRRFYSPRER